MSATAVKDTLDLQHIRTLIEEAGFLPMTKKAERLFAAAKAVPSAAPEVAGLLDAYQNVGYLSRSKALRLLDLASVYLESEPHRFQP